MPANSTAAERFRAHVWHYITAKNLTITKVADDLGMSRPGLSRILHGHEDLTFQRAEKISAYFGRDLCDFLKPTKKFKQPA